MAIIYMKHLKKEWAEKVSEVLSPTHLEDLYKSGLSNETILEARIYSVDSQEAKKLLKRTKEVGPGYVIPYPKKRGFGAGINFKPNKPSLDSEGKSRKYLRPLRSKQQLFIPRPVWAVLQNAKIPLIFTEGEKKALKATQEGFYAIALSGVWGWKSNHQPIDDFKLINFKKRIVYIVFDADKHTNPNVLRAEQELAKYLTSMGAIVKIVDLAEGIL